MSETMMIAIKSILPNPSQPRKYFDKAELDGLAESMASPVGLIQPITVEEFSNGFFTLVDGERRVRAAKLLGWEVIEAVIRPQSNHNGTERLLGSFVANEQRTNMNAMERARAYKQMLTELGSVKAIMEMTGKSEATIYSHLDLNEFEPSIQEYFERGALICSPRVTAALKRLPLGIRETVAIRAATRRVSESTLLAMCKTVSKISPRKRTSVYAETPVTIGAHFNALNLVNGKVLPPPITVAVLDTCQNCDLYDMAEPKTCRSCPMVEFLRRYGG